MMNPLKLTCAKRLYSDESENHDFKMAYCECHMGSTLVGSVRRNRLRAVREMYCVVPAGATTFVFGSASKE
eukprot:14308344-Ditylum_brightwellii.AAC.1